jgi:hypothetical protein
MIRPGAEEALRITLAESAPLFAVRSLESAYRRYGASEPRPMSWPYVPMNVKKVKKPKMYV